MFENVEKTHIRFAVGPCGCRLCVRKREGGQQKIGGTRTATAKSVMKAKGTEPVVLKEKGMWRVKLNSGYDMPVLGLGTWSQNNRTAEESVYTALKNGYRLIDTARYYGNEKGVGEGVRRAISDGADMPDRRVRESAGRVRAKQRVPDDL